MRHDDPHYIAKKTPGAGLKEFEAQVDMAAMRQYRLGRVRADMERRDIGACLLYDMANIRYASGTRNMAVFTGHYPTRYLFVAANGPAILFDSESGSLKDWLPESVDEIRPAKNWYFEVNGDRVADAAGPWADEIDDLMRTHCGANRRLGVDRLGAMGYAPLVARGVEICDAQAVLESARAIKSADEIACMSIAISVTEAGMALMQENLRPGISEQELWTHLAAFNLQKGGEWMETRLLTSGGRTNPWYQECGEKLIRCGDLVAFDTDLIGPFGYCCDISRTFHCGPSRPTDEQKRLYSLARDEIEHNIALLKPGISFRELSENCFKVPEEFLPNRYSCLMHGVGLVDEYPDIVHPLDWTEFICEGAIEENMTLCVESYIGEVGGAEGVKLEEQVLVTANGVQRLSLYPFEEALLA
jgi:Xaa-Pro aminopeptidase